MELKSYQQQALDDLSLYLDKVQETKDIYTAFSQFWYHHPRTPLVPTLSSAIEPYKNNVTGVPHICMKVPTAGGKTFMAANAIKTIFDAYDFKNAKAVVWLVPSVTILEQTLKNLQNPFHPYRQRINTNFRNRVEVYSKDDLLTGSNFNSSSIKENLSIFVLSFDSLRARKKEDRKVYQENGNLLSFESELPAGDDVTLMNIIRLLNPVVIVDESHNAETDLSVEMLQNLNPSFILDLTATPRKNSNIISFVDAFELKKENMVKLPVIVYNQNNVTEVIESGIKMQRKLEEVAKAEEKAGGKYIRPIVLFQAQPKSKDDNTTFEQIKEILIKSNIPEEQIKIKTANINEIKGIDLMDKKCQVRYIITVNALKEGWDCPFAYILASLANKSSAVDVEQILGRILRQPYVMKHKNALLNMSYVLTASSKFQETLQNIVHGLNKAGFSSRDYKIANAEVSQDNVENLYQPNVENHSLFESGKDDNRSENNTTTNKVEDNNDDNIIDYLANHIPNVQLIDTATDDINENDNIINAITQTASEENDKMEKIISESTKGDMPQPIPSDLSNLVKTITMKDVFKQQAKEIRIPQFFMGQTSTLFGDEDIPVDKNKLIENFPLDKVSIDIDFSVTHSEIYKVDLDTSKKDNTPTYLKIDGSDKETLHSYLSAPTTSKKGKINTLTAIVKKSMGSMYPIPDQKLDAYLKRIFETFDNDQYFSFLDNQYSNSLKIRDKINEEANLFARSQFQKFLDIDKIELRPSYMFPITINPVKTIDYLPKSLYEREDDMNNFEREIINEVANMKNVEFWTRNMERTGFKINGFINHYPDFIILTKKGNIVILETKGDHLKAEDKIELGRLWEAKAGKGFKYFLVYNKNDEKGAYRKEEFLDRMKEL